jgi:hypothetical protein
LIVTAKNTSLVPGQQQKPMELPALSRQSPAPASLKAVARALLKDLGSELSAATPATSVHGARRRLKRLGSLLRLMRRLIGEVSYSAANDRSMSAAKALAGQRRSEALVAAVLKLDLGSKSGKALLKLAEDHRDDRETCAAPAERLETARREVAALSALAAAWKIPRRGAEPIAEAFGDSYRKARKKLAGALENQMAEDLHEARKFVIHHLHHLQLLQAWLPDDHQKRLDDLEKLREILGDFNDLAELERLMRLRDISGLRSASRALRKKRNTLLKKAAKAARPLFRPKTEAFVKRVGARWVED